jgi:Ca-activated chloride channel homolog
MFRRRLWRTLLFTGLAWLMDTRFATAQLLGGPALGDNFAGSLTSLQALETARMDPAIFLFYNEHMSPLLDPSNAVSKLDLAAPKNARKEYDKGYLHLIRRELPAAIDHLARATSIYPNFVTAHTALGIAYLNAGQTQQAHDEFVRALALDEHLPGSYLNLGCAQMQLQRYSEAEESLKKAASLAPLDLVLLKALTYAQFKNRNYSAVIATTRQVHRQKHADAALVHLFAAAAWGAQDHLGEAQDELETLLSEDPKSPLSAQFRKILDQVKKDQVSRAQMKRAPADPVRSASSALLSRNAEGAARQILQTSEEMTEHKQIAGANPDAGTTCLGCRDGGSGGPAPPAGASPASEQADANVAHQVIRVAVEEVAMLFAVTDHGKSVTDLRSSDIKIRDDGQPPDAVLGFHNVTQLPLRIGLVIDTSNSITDRFLFEEAAASKFLETVVTDKNDLAFVIGFNCSVLLAQDFTPEKTLTAHALAQLAPGGGTALWDAVGYAADKLASHPEAQPVARILVVISDGGDNSSSISLQQAIWKAQRGEVAIYTVSTKEGSQDEPDPLVGNRALKTLSEQTGGAIFASGSLGDITRRLAELEQVLRGRYLVYYNPASHQPDGRYHAVEIRAEKDGHKLKVIARKGYYASALVDAGI